jgi:twinkle protein
MSKAEGHVLEVIEQQTQTKRIRCPSCGPERKKKHEATLSVSVDGDTTMYQCWHCGLSGRIDKKPFYEDYMSAITPIPTKLNTSTAQILKYFNDRGIPLESLDGLPPMTVGTRYYTKLGKEAESIGFVYGTEDKPEAIKWRAIKNKAFTQDGAARSLWGWELLTDTSEMLVLTEGEVDVVAMASAGIRAVSCPNGAPMKVSQRRVREEDDNKFSFIWDVHDELDRCKRVVLAVDGDEQGAALAEEVARRVGRAKCWLVKYPDGCKDAADVVANHGADKLREIVNAATPLPLQGVFGASDYLGAVMDSYAEGYGHGESTGIKTLDDFYTVAPGQLTVVTGHPGSGKSELVDQIMVNLAENNGWRFAVASMENPPSMHIIKLSEKIVRKPFFDGPIPRMSQREVEDANAYIDKHFSFLDSKDGMPSTIESIIDRTKQAIMRMGINGLVIDPYNYLENEGEQEHRAISTLLTKVISFAKAYGIHVWFIAHPKSMIPRQDGTFAIPTGMHISGGPTWFAKADCGLTAHRGERGTEVHSWKVRWKWVGRANEMTYLDYHVPTGRYTDYPTTTMRPMEPMSAMSAKTHWQDLQPD